MINLQPNEEEKKELDEFYNKLAKASIDAHREKVSSANLSQGQKIAKLNSSIEELPIVEYVKPKVQDVDHILYVMKKMHCMTTTELRKELKFFHIEARGKRSVIYERLKKYIRKHSPRALEAVEPSRGKTGKFYDFLIVIDFECTCDEFIIDYPHEIIEFPAVLVDVHRREVVDTFRSIVRPVLNPHLSEFCINLTGVTQEMIDESLPFIDVLDSFRRWMSKNDLGKETSRYAFVTDGPWDIAKFFQMQCIQSKITIPHDFRHYINIRKSFLNKYHRRGNGTQKTTLNGMLTELNMTFDGREHSGIDDSRNIARVVVRMLQDGTEIRVNERLQKRKPTDKVRVAENLTKEESERTLWRNTLPYKIVLVNRDSFISGEYLDCESCDEAK